MASGPAQVPAANKPQIPASASRLATDVLAVNNGEALSEQELASAFQLFNDVSAKLTETYQAMEQKVGLLNQELHDLAEQRLQDLQAKERVTQRLESLLKLLPAGVLVLDRQGIITEANPAAHDLLGEPLQGQLWRDVIQRAFEPRSDDGHEISLRDGRRVSIATRSFTEESGQLLLLTDLTETRELQRRLNQHQRLSEMGRMMSSLAHQIRTPLSAAMLYAGHLNQSELNEQQIRRFSGKVLSRLNHLEQQIKDMLIFVKGDVKLTETISVQELLQSMQSAMEVPLAAANMQCRIESDCQQLNILCNPDSLVGALMNLVSNAIQALESDHDLGDAELRLLCSQQGNSLRLEVIDNGPGISSAELARLQQPFYTTKDKGTGLGLAVVRAVTQAHQGEFSLLPAAGGRGTVARIELPLFVSKAGEAVLVGAE